MLDLELAKKIFKWVLFAGSIGNYIGFYLSGGDVGFFVAGSLCLAFFFIF